MESSHAPSTPVIALVPPGGRDADQGGTVVQRRKLPPQWRRPVRGGYNGRPAVFMPEGVVEVHGAASDDGETVGNTAGDEKVGYIVGKTNFHMIYPFR